MHIGYDARILAHPKSGIGTYLANLIRKIKDSEEVTLFSDRQLSRDYSEIVSDVQCLTFGMSHRKYWAQFLLPHQLSKRAIDVYHATWNNAVPIFTRCPCVLTIHDIAPWHFPWEFTSFRKEMKYKLQEMTAAHRAGLVITVSEYSRRDIELYLKVPASKIRVIYHGVEEIFLRRPDEKEISKCREHFNIERDYIITIGDMRHRRKNIGFLIKAFERLIPELPIDLLIVGRKYEDGAQFINSKDRIKFTGHLSGDELSLLLNGARVMGMPSLYEGFGLPLLEAMSVGVPIVATNVASIPEIVQDAAILVEPGDINGFANAIREVFLDSEKRASLIERGWQRMKDFSWDEAAGETLRVYEELGGRR